MRSSLRPRIPAFALVAVALAAEAFDATEAHARRFPRGRLSEEREALAVQALVAPGAVSTARLRADRFRRTYPNSIFRSAVERAIAPVDDKASDR